MFTEVPKKESKKKVELKYIYIFQEARAENLPVSEKKNCQKSEQIGSRS